MVLVSRSGSFSVRGLVKSFICYTPFRLGDVNCPRSARAGRGRTIGAQFDEAKQHLIPLRLQLLNGTRPDLGMDAVNERLLHLRRQHRRAEGLPPGRHRAAELLEEVLNAART